MKLENHNSIQWNRELNDMSTEIKIGDCVNNAMFELKFDEHSKHLINSPMSISSI